MSRVVLQSGGLGWLVAMTKPSERVCTLPQMKIFAEDQFENYAVIMEEAG
jgi:hypothetical protein